MKVDFLFVCSEGWEKMIPNQTGAYCNTCRKDVVDFSDKKKGELEKVLKTEAEGKEFCGRFKPSQILELNFSDFFKKFLLWNLRKRIAIVFFFVMGTMMFSCTSIPGFQKEERLAGTVAWHDTSQVRNIPNADSLNKITTDKK